MDGTSGGQGWWRDGVVTFLRGASGAALTPPALAWALAHGSSAMLMLAAVRSRRYP
jgi:hypothetical protein